MGTKIARFRPELLPSPSAFYPRELRNIGRRSPKGWVRALCPFHPDTHASFEVNLQTGGFYCFSCGEKGGDLIDFLRKRDGVCFKTAAQLLGAWDKSQVITACQVRELQRRGEDRRYAHEARIAEERGKRLKAREWLHFLEHLYDQDSERLSQLRRGSPGQFPGEEEACWEFMSEMLPAIRRAETNYRRIAELRLEEFAGD
jgi:hypothetical protein